MLMTPSAACLGLIKAFEGFRATPYSDAAGHATVGYGHKITPDEHFDAITTSQANDLLDTDACKTGEYVNCVVTVELNQNQFDALVSFTYNLGIGNLEKSTLLEMLNQGDYSGAAEQFLRWDKAGGETLPGLVHRRLADSELFSKPV